MAEKTAIDELGDMEFFRKIVKHFGTRRAAEIFGYAVVIGASGKVLPSEIVAALVKVGFSKSGVYRALADIRAFALEMERERGHTVPMETLFAEIQAAGASHTREPVL